MKPIQKFTLNKNEFKSTHFYTGQNITVTDVQTENLQDNLK